ncbi:MAG: c-type cytochrome [Balneolales bacterium]
MKKYLYRIVLGVVSFLVVIVLGAVMYLTYALPDVDPAPDLIIDRTPERISQGAYLVNNVLICMDCHSERDWTKFSGPLVEGSLGMGGELFDEGIGLPGRYYAPNITPYGIGDWTDGEVFRALTSGVNRDGKALFPLMPYPDYANMDEEDIYSVIAYLRTLEPIEYDVPESKSNFPMNLIINTMPVKPNLQKKPDKNNAVNYGQYLVNSAGCKSCHTRFENGSYFDDMELAGNREFPMPDGSVVKSANITFHTETGIGTWTKETFIERFKAYEDPELLNTIIEPGAFNTVMPWTLYSKLTHEDLEAIYEYLKSVEPIENQIVQVTQQ